VSREFRAKKKKKKEREKKKGMKLDWIEAQNGNIMCLTLRFCR
jgi:hypothetical protein